MELHEIHYFLAVGKTLNFTRAAEICHVSQPALTRAIQKMEGELGGLLFSRERGNTHLTELGRLIEPCFQQIAEQTRTAKQTAQRFSRLDNAQLRLGVMGTIGPLRLVEFLRRFCVEHPGIELTLLEAQPPLLCEQLKRAEIDAALMARPEGFASPLTAQRLYSERFVIACAAAHRFSRENAVRVAELDGESYLQRSNCEYRDRLRAACDASGARIVRYYRSEREDWTLSMVAAGMGVCFLPEYCNTVAGVISRPAIDPSISRTVCLVTVCGRRWSAPLAAFMTAIRAYPWGEPKHAEQAG